MDFKLSLLIIEDNALLAQQLGDYFTETGYRVDYAYNGESGIRFCKENRYDVVILDLSLPDIDGIQVCQQIKSDATTIIPVLMLTARDALHEKLEGFEAGTDDYVTKPYEASEVLVRCQALARRNVLHQTQEINIGPLQINQITKDIFREGTKLNLSQKDRQILMTLAQAHPAPVSRTELLDKLWGEDFPDSDVLKSHIYTLRQALDKPFSHSMLKTIHGVGYRLQEQA
ncbi:response regulator transcription factor [Shewanella sp. 10N.286.52.B9]|uniref:response regulator transcription factor n=1 Tax=Shewanella sp. 10N.286.52.B9 TaxID=1880837 RepID=UPI000C8344AC|nr:response regulator transcription factor [Shewanella sp. 10N.286.52.B9]PMG41107.1 DNA-binding response regulator [Shewanella sp. 10N.286.52.B9]